MKNDLPIDLAASIRGRTALVTGGSRGIGRECVKALLAHGARVAFTYNRHGEEAQAIVRAEPERASCHFLDLGRRESIRACVAEVVDRWGELHVLVNNAAVGTATVADYEPDPERKDDALFEINAMGPFWVCRYALEALQRAGGGARKVINVSSVGGVQVFPSMRLADNMSKAAVVYMSQQLAAEMAQSEIDVFVVCPGATDTEMFRASSLDKLAPDERARFIAALPKRRLVAPEEVANVIVFLASAHSTVLNGAVLDLSMGLGVHPGLLTGQAH
jgi:NAD(P)-dependent dehydrogenase (short-subunit alcohol dehydrogenase family)